MSSKSQVSSRKSVASRKLVASRKSVAGRVPVFAAFAFVAAFASFASARGGRGLGRGRPFRGAPGVEKPLATGLGVIATGQRAVPKVPVMLRVLSVFASAPADLTGLAQMTA